MININSIVQTVYLLAGLIHTIIFIKIIYFYYFQIKKWEVCQGKIISNEKVYYRSKTDSDTEGYKDEIIYEYFIDNKKYTNNKISKNIGILLPSKNQTSPLSHDDFKANQVVDIYYNPSKPNDSIIDSKFNFFSLVVVIILYLIGYLFIF